MPSRCNFSEVVSFPLNHPLWLKPRVECVKEEWPAVCFPVEPVQLNGSKASTWWLLIDMTHFVHKLLFLNLFIPRVLKRQRTPPLHPLTPYKCLGKNKAWNVMKCLEKYFSDKLWLQNCYRNLVMVPRSACFVTLRCVSVNLDQWSAIMELHKWTICKQVKIGPCQNFLVLHPNAAYIFI